MTEARRKRIEYLTYIKKTITMFKEDWFLFSDKHVVGSSDIIKNTCDYICAKKDDVFVSHNDLDNLNDISFALVKLPTDEEKSYEIYDLKEHSFDLFNTSNTTTFAKNHDTKLILIKPTSVDITTAKFMLKHYFDHSGRNGRYSINLVDVRHDIPISYGHFDPTMYSAYGLSRACSLSNISSSFDRKIRHNIGDDSFQIISVDPFNEAYTSSINIEYKNIIEVSFEDNGDNKTLIIHFTDYAYIAGDVKLILNIKYKNNDKMASILESYDKYLALIEEELSNEDDSLEELDECLDEINAVTIPSIEELDECLDEINAVTIPSIEEGVINFATQCTITRFEEVVNETLNIYKDKLDDHDIKFDSIDVNIDAQTIRLDCHDIKFNEHIAEITRLRNDISMLKRIIMSNNT